MCEVSFEQGKGKTLMWMRTMSFRAIFYYDNDKRYIWDVNEEIRVIHVYKCYAYEIKWMGGEFNFSKSYLI